MVRGRSLSQIATDNRFDTLVRHGSGGKRQITSKTTAYVEIQGLNTVVTHWYAAAAIIEDIAPQIMDITGEMTIFNARQLVRIRTGDTWRSINKDPGPFFAGGNLLIEVGPTTPYSRFLEWGTVNHIPYPFMIPAADFVAPSFISAMMELAGVVDQIPANALSGRGEAGKILHDPRVRAPLSGLRSFLYSTEKALGDINVLFGSSQIGGLRTSMLGLARVAGDVQSTITRTVSQRITRRLQGRATGTIIGYGSRSLFASRSVSALTGGSVGLRVYNRAVGRAAGAGLGSIQSFQQTIFQSFRG